MVQWRLGRMSQPPFVASGRAFCRVLIWASANASTGASPDLDPDLDLDLNLNLNLNLNLCEHSSRLQEQVARALV